MSIRMKPNEDHEVVGGEFCSGYTDSFGKWNAGFYCPGSLGDDISDAVYCCGTSYIKYCCTKKEELQAEIPDLTLILGIVCGTIFAVTIIVIGSCFFCSFCLLYKRRHACANGPLYQLQSSSGSQGIANMQSFYSFSNQNSSHATTPIDTNGAHAELDYAHHMHHQHHLAAAGIMQVDSSGRPVHSFAAVDLIPLNAPIGSGSDNDNPRDDGDDVPDDEDEEEDAPPPYEATMPLPVAPPVVPPQVAVTAPPPVGLQEVANNAVVGLSSPRSSCSSSTRSASGSGSGSATGSGSSSSAGTSTGGGRRSGSTPSGAATVGSLAADSSAPVLTVVDTSSPQSTPPTLQSPESITDHESSFGQMAPSNNHHLMTESPVPTLPSSHSSHTSENSGQAPTTPSSEETLYWSTKF